MYRHSDDNAFLDEKILQSSGIYKKILKSQINDPLDTPDKKTLLHWAIGENNYRLFTYLIAQGADLLVYDNQQNSLLHYAVRSQHNEFLVDLIQIAKQLFSNSLNQNAKRQKTQIEDQSEKNQVDFEAFINSKNYFGQSALYWLLNYIYDSSIDEYAYFTRCKLLLQNGADLFQYDHKNSTMIADLYLLYIQYVFSGDEFTAIKIEKLLACLAEYIDNHGLRADLSPIL